mmetsp:Transcript_17245/g.30243  ORF Transcript_17245/g.30243 Transcript_17245/m.30243 type:complete len:204 (+) Transcript_17245:1925-2536(+)
MAVLQDVSTSSEAAPLKNTRFTFASAARAFCLPSFSRLRISTASVRLAMTSAVRPSRTTYGVSCKPCASEGASATCRKAPSWSPLAVKDLASALPRNLFRRHRAASSKDFAVSPAEHLARSASAPFARSASAAKTAAVVPLGPTCAAAAATRRRAAETSQVPSPRAFESSRASAATCRASAGAPRRRCVLDRDCSAEARPFFS